jgi:hypothetical protein
MGLWTETALRQLAQVYAVYCEHAEMLRQPSGGPGSEDAVQMLAH